MWKCVASVSIQFKLYYSLWTTKFIKLSIAHAYRGFAALLTVLGRTPLSTGGKVCEFACQKIIVFFPDTPVSSPIWIYSKQSWLRGHKTPWLHKVTMYSTLFIINILGNQLHATEMERGREKCKIRLAFKHLKNV